jgi:hypothetical protein
LHNEDDPTNEGDQTFKLNICVILKKGEVNQGNIDEPKNQAESYEYTVSKK